MAMTQDATDRDPSTMTVADIDRELAMLTTTLDTMNDVAIALAYARRREVLERARPVAAGREQQAQEDLEARDTFERLAAELLPELAEHGAAWDRWMADGARLADATRATIQKCAAVEDVLGPPPPGRELHLHGFFSQLAPGQALEAGLARAGVLPHIILPPMARADRRTVKAHMVDRGSKYFAAARPRLPALVCPDDGDEVPGI